MLFPDHFLAVRGSNRRLRMVRLQWVKGGLEQRSDDSRSAPDTDRLRRNPRSATR